jgi:hypothetical protein
LDGEAARAYIRRTRASRSISRAWSSDHGRGRMYKYCSATVGFRSSTLSSLLGKSKLTCLLLHICGRQKTSPDPRIVSIASKGPAVWIHVFPPCENSRSQRAGWRRAAHKNVQRTPYMFETTKPRMLAEEREFQSDLRAKDM